MATHKQKKSIYVCVYGIHTLQYTHTHTHTSDTCRACPTATHATLGLTYWVPLAGVIVNAIPTLHRLITSASIATFAGRLFSKKIVLVCGPSSRKWPSTISNVRFAAGVALLRRLRLSLDTCWQRRKRTKIHSWSLLSADAAPEAASFKFGFRIHHFG